MSKREALKIWLDSAKRDKKMAEDSFLMKHYDWSLFFWQLVLEKVLKALIVSRDKEIVLTHNLTLLAKICGIELAEEEKMELNEITTFNIEARYESIKSEFYRKANKVFSTKWVIVCSKYYDRFVKEVKSE